MKKLVEKVRSSGLRKLCIYCVPPQRDKMLPYAQAEQILSRHCPDSRVTCPEDNRQMADYDLSVIVLMDNREDYPQCLDSVFTQKTHYRYEVVAVHGGALDISGEIPGKYREKENFRLIPQSDRCLRQVRGRYLMFVAPGDFLPEHAVQSLLDAATSRNADMVQGRSCPGDAAGMVWGRVFKAALWENVCFPKGCWLEDTVMTSLLTHLSDNLATVSHVVYHRRDSAAAGKPGSIDTFYVLRSVLEARRQRNLPTDSAFYEYLMGLMVQCIRRTGSEPDPVRKSIFTLFQKLLQEERCRADVEIPAQYNLLEELLLQGDYRRFRLLCAVW